MIADESCGTIKVIVDCQGQIEGQIERRKEDKVMRILALEAEVRHRRKPCSTIQRAERMKKIKAYGKMYDEEVLRRRQGV